MNFDNTLKVNEQKDKTNYKLQLRSVNTDSTIKMVQHF